MSATATRTAGLFTPEASAGMAAPASAQTEQAEDDATDAATEELKSEEQLIAEQIEAMDSEAWEKIGSALNGMVGELDRLANEQVTRKILIENRWLEDLRQYHGRYSADTEMKLREADKSQVFANLTRPKTHAWAARLGDMLFPADEENWDISPPPDPKLVDKLQQAGYQARGKIKQANRHLDIAAHKQIVVDDYNDNQPPPPPAGPQMTALGGAVPVPPGAAPGIAQPPAVPSATSPTQQAPQPHPLDPEIDGHLSAAQRLQSEAAEHAAYALEQRAALDESADKADAMKEVIKRQLLQAKWNIKNRTAILDMCKLGTCVLKSPITKPTTRGCWSTDGGETKLQFIEDPTPEGERVDPWNWFPDMSARTPDDREFDFERHLYGERAMRKLAKKPGFNRDAIRRIINQKSPDAPPNYLILLRDISGNPNIAIDKRWIIWEYHGPMKAQDIRKLSVAMLPPNKAAVMLKDLQNDDPLLEREVIVWFGHGEILKFGVHPLDSEENLYDSTTFLEDDSSLFGYGVPYIMRNSQAVVNGSWRMMMDNGGISAGPQVVVNENVLTPADGVMNVTGNKLWLYQQGKTLPPQSLPPFQVFNIQNNQEQLINLIKLALEFIDIEISLPLIAQGEQGTHPETQGGRSMLMNSANVIFRWVVKGWDDNITTPAIRKFYDWNMQHSKVDYIKGDYLVEARGSSTLMVRDVMAQNLAAILAQFSGHPVLGPLTKVANAYRKLIQCYGMNQDDIVKTDDEIQADQEAAQQNPQPNADQIKLQIAQMVDATKKELAGVSKDTALAGIAAKMNVSLDQLKNQLGMQDTDLAHKERLFAAQLAADLRTDANDRAATMLKERMINAREKRPGGRKMPKDTHAAATSGGDSTSVAPSGEVSGG